MATTDVNGGPGIYHVSGVSYAPNGDLLGLNDPILGYTWGYSYDDFNRLATTTQTGAPQNVAYSYDYDRYGNRWHQTVTAGTGWPSSLSFDSNNHIAPAACGSSAYCYDAAGNLTNDTFHSYTYDAEGRIGAVDATVATYVYDALGRRARATTGGHTWDYGYDLGSRVVWELEDTSWYRGEIYAGSSKLATYIAGLTFFSSQDFVGTVRDKMTQEGVTFESCYLLPFGDGKRCWGGSAGATGPAWFTGQDRDSESNLDHFQFRAYSSTEGRWTTPDPAGLAAVDLMNPQTWNRYAYVENNPVSFTDPLGLATCTDGDGNKVDCPDPENTTTVTAAPEPGPDETWMEFIRSRTSYGAPLPHIPFRLRLLHLTFGVRARGQTWKGCMAANANNYSMGGATELAANVATGTSTSYSSNPIVSTFTGNGVSGLMFGEGTDAAQTGLTSAPDLINAGMGTVTTYGRNSTDIVALNIARSGGAPQALSSASRGVGGFLESASSFFSLGMSTAYRWGVDSALTGAEAIGCSVPRGD